MTAIREVATLTCKGQVTLPKSIRQALRLDTGSKIRFDLQGEQVLVSRADFSTRASRHTLRRPQGARTGRS